MSNIPFKCPGCNHNLTVHSRTEISDAGDTTGIICVNCSLIINKEDIIQQASDHAAMLVKTLLRERNR